MKHGNIEILDLDFEYKLWKNRLIFYKSEIELLIDRTHVLSREIQGWEIDKKANILLGLQYKSIVNLEKRIRTQESAMSHYAVDYPINSKHAHYVEHEKIRKEMEKCIFRHDEIMDNIFPDLCYPITPD